MGIKRPRLTVQSTEFARHPEGSQETLRLLVEEEVKSGYTVRSKTGNSIAMAMNYLEEQGRDYVMVRCDGQYVIVPSRKEKTNE